MFFSFFFLSVWCYFLVLNCLQVCRQSIVIMLMLFSQSDFFHLIVTGILIGSWKTIKKKKCCRSQRASFNQFSLDLFSIRWEETLVNVGAWANRTEPDESFPNMGDDLREQTRSWKPQINTRTCTCYVTIVRVFLGVMSEVLFLTHVTNLFFCSSDFYYLWRMWPICVIKACVECFRTWNQINVNLMQLWNHVLSYLQHEPLSKLKWL